MITSCIQCTFKLVKKKELQTGNLSSRNMVFSSMPVFIRHYNQPSLAELYAAGNKEKTVTSVVVNSDGMIHIKTKNAV